MQFHDDIQALRRGEVDHETILDRIRAYLGRSGSDAVALKNALDQAREADHITAADYDLLTQCIADASQVPSSAPPASKATTGTELDDSVTRLATSMDFTGGEGPSEVDVGSRLRDRFILDEVIGAGGMGTVYRGRDMLKIEAQDRNPYVAIKILNDSFKERPDAFIVLQREASRQQRLAHPNIATVYDFDRTGGVIFITMEYLDGVSLDHFIKHEVRPTGGLPLSEALPVIEGMCAALSHAHARNIVHADFKPGNCFITQSKQLKVLDFGIARAMKDPARAGEETLFDPRSIGALTPAYASPEMLDNTEDADPRDDIYALACVSYELLSGRHPFHRIPADQARANHLKPDRIKHLTRRQNDALARALAFDRDKRTATVSDFLEGLSQSSGGLGSVKAALAVGAGAVVVVGALIVPGFMDRWSGDRLIEQINAGRIDSALARLEELSRQQQIRVLQEGRPQILAHFQQDFDALTERPDPEVDFQAAERVLGEASELYPDSAVLVDLTNRYEQRRESYLSELAQDFERYLSREFLLPRADGDDLHDLLARLRAVDPTNPLLEDSRIPGAYADSVETALGSEDYAAAREYLDAGLALTAEDATLTDLRDRVVAAEQRLARETAIAQATSDLRSAASAAQSLDDVEAMLPLVNELTALDPDTTVVDEVGGELAGRFAAQARAVAEADGLPEVESYLTRAAPLWAALEQPGMTEPAEARRDALMSRQEELVGLTRQAISGEDMRADGRSAVELIEQVRSIDPDDPRPAVLLSELVQARRARAEAQMDAAQWDAARAELAALDDVALTAEQRESLSTDARRIDDAEQQARQQAAAAERLAEAQQQAERQRLEQERQQRLAAQRQTRIDEAAAAIDQSLTDFDTARAVPSMRTVLNRINTLEGLQADHPSLATAQQRLDTVVERSIRQQPSTEAGLALIATTEDVLGNRPYLDELRSSLEARQRAEEAATRRAAIAAAQADLRDTLANEMALADESARESARRALAALAGLVGEDAAALSAARQDYVSAHLSAADRLAAEKRFSVAASVLNAAEDQAGGGQTSLVADARSSLEAARDAFRQERDRQETLARIEALAQRFNLEVGAGQLTRARATLSEYRELDPDGELAGQEGARRLADGYQRVGRQRLEAGNLDGARELAVTGLEVLPGHGGLTRLQSDIERTSLHNRIARWFSGADGAPVTTMRTLTQRYRELAPDSYGDQEVAWASSAANRLLAMQDDHEAYNRFLQDARSLLNDDGALAGLSTIVPPARVQDPPVTPELDVVSSTRPDEIVEQPETPRLSSADLLGRWCADTIEIEFERQRMVFTLNGGEVNYRVDGYDVNGDTIHVNWDDRRLGPMIFEFGQFTESKDRMVQIRGRPADESAWQTYNRDFLRCG